MQEPCLLTTARTNMYKILIIEDDRAILKAVEANLLAEGYEVETATDGVTGLERAFDPAQDLILLDLMLPRMPGEEICRRLRQSGITTPILFLTAKSEEEHRIAGFELGADDYVAKPFSIRELLGRIQAIIRRAAGQKHLLAHYHFADVSLDFVKMEARKRDEPVTLTTREFAILRLMVSNKGVVISRDRLLNEVWGYDSYPTTRTVDNQIVKLRQKLEDDPENPRYILTVRGTGYKFVG
jgi:DNA-binding response OmpR family regulator